MQGAALGPCWPASFWCADSGKSRYGNGEGPLFRQAALFGASAALDEGGARVV